MSGQLGVIPAGGAALWSVGWAARGGGSPELAVYSAPDLGF
jgi:hypothetical protein